MNYSKITIKKSARSFVDKDKSELIISSNDLNPNSKFILDKFKINNEKATNVEIKNILETTEHIRYLFKLANQILKPNGNLKISFIEFDFDQNSSPFRNYISIMNEFSLSLRDHFVMTHNKKNNLIRSIEFKKVKSYLPKNDHIDQWTFGVVYGGENPSKIDELINSIIIQNIPKFEIVICGPYNGKYSKIGNIKIITDTELYVDSRIPISRKKNKIIDYAKYNNLVLLHDRFTLSKDWFKKISLYGNYFDCLCPRILDYETKKDRVQDWIITALDHFDFKRIFSQSMYLDYNKWLPNWNINGGLIIIKKNLISMVKYNENLHWGEAEDGNLCRRLDSIGVNPVFYYDLIMFSKTNRLSPSKKINNSIIKTILRIKINVMMIFKYFYRITVFKKNNDY